VTLGLALLGLLSFAACGGGGSFNFGTAEDVQQEAWPAHGFEGALSSQGFQLVAVDSTDKVVDSALTSQLKLDVQPRGSGYRVEVRGSGLTPRANAYLHLKYDGTVLRPLRSELSPALDDEVIFLGLTDVPGVSALGLAAIGGQDLLSGDTLLCSIEFEAGAATPHRNVSAVNAATVADLHFSVTSPQDLMWSYRCSGDYDQNGRVAIQDLTPIGIYFQANSGDSNWPAAQVADGNGDSFVTVQDLTPIGINYLTETDGYQVQSGPAPTGPFSFVTEVLLSSALLPEDNSRKQFSHTLASPVQDAWYVVVAYDGSQTADDPSNAVQYLSGGSFPPPSGLSAFDSGGQVTLNWTAPAGETPDSYDAYWSDSPSMASPTKINTGGPILNTTFNSGLDSGLPYYFAVRAIYGGNESANSNIFAYSPFGAPPQNTMAADTGTLIQVSWQVPVSGTPDGYDVWVDHFNSDMSTATKVNTNPVVATSLNVPPANADPEAEHYFAVKAVYGVNQSGYSNIFHYAPDINPGDTDPPGWDNAGEEGIKSATPGDAQVSIEWYTATDSESPPVSYQIFYAESSSGINWAGAPQDTSGPGTTMKTIGGLTNDVSYDFGVRAVDASNNATTNTNFLSATPFAGATPVDSGIWQTPELVDDGGILGSQQLGVLSDIELAPDGSIGIAHYNFSSLDLVYTHGTAGNWISETVDSQGDTGLWPDLAFDPVTEEPCIAYHNATNFACMFARKTASGWEISPVDDGNGDLGAFASLAFDPDDNLPAVAYWNAQAYDTKYAKFNGTDWTRTVAYNGSTTSLGLSGSQCSLAFNPATGDPAISYMHCYDQSAIGMASCWIATHNGSSWSNEEVDLGPYFDFDIGTSGFTTSLVFDDDNFPWIVHLDFVNNEVRISERTQGFWATDYADTISGTLDILQQTDAVWAADGIHWVVFDKNAGQVLYGVGYTPGAVIEGGGKGGSPSLVQDGNGDWHSSYMDQNNDLLRYAFKDGANPWEPETAMDGAGAEGVVGDVASLQMQGFPRISYSDASNSSVKFADKQPGSWRVETVSNDGYDGSASGLALAPNGSHQLVFFSLAEDGQSGGLYLAEGGFGTWGFTAVQEFNTTLGGDVVGNYCSIANSGLPDGFPGIAYNNTSQTRCEFAYGDGEGSFEQTIVDDVVGEDPGRWTSAGFNPDNGFPGVAYYERDGQDLRFSERNAGGLWITQPVDASQDVGQHCSMVYGANTARPWISYYDGTAERLKVAYLSAPPAPAWQTIIIDPPAGSTNYGLWSSIAWHPLHNRAAVAFYDSSNGKLWYVFIGDPDAPQAAVEVDGPPGVNVGASCSLSFDAITQQPSIAYQDVTNGDLYYVERMPN
jgi:hypothetical protein